MAEFPQSGQRKDPYKNYKFRIKIDQQYVAGLSKCTGLKKTTEVIEWRESGDPSVVRKLMGRTSFQPVTLEGGVTHDTTFQDWANQVNNNDGSDASMDLSKYRKDIILELYREDDKKVLEYTIKRAWISEYQALPDLDAGAHAVAITSIKIENEGWIQTGNTDPGNSL
jgi:phage tail-like protein